MAGALLVTAGVAVTAVAAVPPGGDPGGGRHELAFAGGVVPHHEPAAEIIGRFFARLAAGGEPDTVVILSPDHYHAALAPGRSFIVPAPETARLGNLALDGRLAAAAGGQCLAYSDAAVRLEHGVTVLLPYLEKHFPRSRLLPVIISPRAGKREVAALVAALDRLAGLRASWSGCWMCPPASWPTRNWPSAITGSSSISGNSSR